MKPRKPWLAGLLSGLLPGLGQLYDGAPSRALLAFVGQILLGALGLVALVLPIGPLNVLSFLLLLIGPYVWIVVDATLLARRRQAITLRRYNRWYVYLALVLLVGFVIQPRLLEALHGLAQSYRIPGTSMEPTVLAGDYLVARPLSGSARAALHRRDLAIFVLPDSFSLGPALKRVVGVGGDTVEMRRKVLYLNGRPQHEPYVEYTDRENDVFVPSMLWQKRVLPAGADSAHYRPTRDNWGPFVVPPAHYFVLGDNRDDSMDSRFYGWVPVASFIGRPATIYFSRDPDHGPVRWDRIGRSLQ